MEQLTFPLKKAITYSASDFVVTPSNHLAHAYIASWPAWPTIGGVIVGPSCSGKTHLSHLWQKKTGASWISLDTLRAFDLEKLESGVFIIEDIDLFLPEYEEPLFHLFNHIKSQKGFLLMTSTVAPKFWRIRLKDLISRLSSLPVFEIKDPDDTLFLAILTKSFSDHQLQISPKVLEFILKQVPRTFESLKHIPQQLSDMSLRKRCNITIPFVKETLGL